MLYPCVLCVSLNANWTSQCLRNTTFYFPLRGGKGLLYNIQYSHVTVRVRGGRADRAGVHRYLWLSLCRVGVVRRNDVTHVLITLRYRFSQRRLHDLCVCKHKHTINDDDD